MKSTQDDCIAPSRKGKHLNESERQQIERWLLKGLPVKQIATLLQRHPSSIYREIKRGTVTNIRSDLREYQVYRAQQAQEDYLCNCGASGPYLKLA
ncbi:MAG: helix-turn-helix domain-containing protein [Akkermansia sp.]|nr:helix-turn-helix domain-containing protein [Akkermansia sp.]